MNTQPYQSVEVTDGKVVVTTKDEGCLWATDIACNDEYIYSNTYTSFAVTITNTTAYEYQGALYVSIFERTGKFEQRRSDPVAISVPSGKKIEVDIPMRIEVSKGKYCIYITNEKKEKLSYSIQVSILEEPESPDLKVSNFTLNSTSQDYLQVSYTVTNNGNDYRCMLRSWLQFTNLQYTSSYVNSDTLTIANGKSVDITQTWSYYDGVIGEEYICTLWCQDLRKGGMKQLTKENIRFTMTEPTDLIATQCKSISVYPNPATNYVIVNNAEEVEQINIINSQGHTVVHTTCTTIDVSALPAGVYYVICNRQNTTTTNKILIK
jgi:hypothetical protein